MPKAPIAIYYEHQEWFKPLFSILDSRGIQYEQIDARSHFFDPSETSVPWSLVVNRASPSAGLRGNENIINYTLHWLRHLAKLGAETVNGWQAYSLELSKANQLDLLNSLKLPFPRTIAINNKQQALAAAKQMRSPVLVKANVGGSGAGIVRYDTVQALELAVLENTVNLGIDGTALIQESVPLRDGHITRVETLNGKFLYAINVYPPTDSFDLCPADACQTTTGVELVRGACAIDAPKSGMRVEMANPPKEIISQVELISRMAGMDICGVEYFTDDRDGQHYFYDINALSNFVADAPNVIGFDPWELFVDYLVDRRDGKLKSA